MSSRSESPLVDARGQVFQPLIRPARIISLVPSLTELLFDFGLDETEIVGRTRFCVHPATRVRSIPSIGGTKTTDTARILAQRPTLVLANKEENLRDTVLALDAHVPVFVTNPRNVADALRMVLDLGLLLREHAAAAALHQRLAHAFEALRAAGRGSALYLIWREPWMAAAPGTYIDAMMSHLGFDNALDAGMARDITTNDSAFYPTISLEHMARLAPRHILLSSEPFPFSPAHAEELRTAVHLHDASWAASVDIRTVDGELFSWYGSRVLHIRNEAFL